MCVPITYGSRWLQDCLQTNKQIGTNKKEQGKDPYTQETDGILLFVLFCFLGYISLFPSLVEFSLALFSQLVLLADFMSTALFHSFSFLLLSFIPFYSPVLTTHQSIYPSNQPIQLSSPTQSEATYMIFYITT